MAQTPGFQLSFSSSPRLLLDRSFNSTIAATYSFQSSGLAAFRAPFGTAEIIEDVNDLFPLLSSSRPEMTAYRRRLDNEPRVLQQFPVFECNPTTWASIDRDTYE